MKKDAALDMALIVFVLGAKGGVGKSLMVMLILAWLLEKGEKVLLVETDPSNPDTAKTYGGCVDVVTAYFREDGVGQNFVNLIRLLMEKSREYKYIIVNTPGGCMEDLRMRGSVLRGLPNMITVWPVDKEIDSVEMLEEYITEIVPDKPLSVVLNGGINFALRESEFVPFNDFAKDYEVNSVYLPPSAPPSIASMMRTGRTPLHEVWDKLDFASVMIGEDWARKALDAAEKVITGAAVPVRKADG